MTEQELINRQLEYGDKLFAVTSLGNFFSAYDHRLFALVYSTGYRVMRRQGLTTGFSESRLEHVLEQIEAAHWQVAANCKKKEYDRINKSNDTCRF